MEAITGSQSSEGIDPSSLLGGEPSGSAPVDAGSHAEPSSAPHAPAEGAPHSEPIASDAGGGDATVVTFTEHADGHTEIHAAQTDAEGHVTVVEVEIDADGHAHGEVVEVDSEGHVLHAEHIEVQPDGEVTVVEVDVDHDGAADGHPPDGGAHSDTPVHHEETSHDGAHGEEWVFDTDDYVPSTTPGDDWSPEG